MEIIHKPKFLCAMPYSWWIFLNSTDSIPARAYQRTKMWWNHGTRFSENFEKFGIAQTIFKTKLLHVSYLMNLATLLSYLSQNIMIAALLFFHALVYAFKFLHTFSWFPFSSYGGLPCQNLWKRDRPLDVFFSHHLPNVRGFFQLVLLRDHLTCWEPWKYHE